MSKKYLLYLLKKNKILIIIQTMLTLLVFPVMGMRNIIYDYSFYNDSGYVFIAGMTYVRVLLIASIIGYAFFISIRNYRMRSIDINDSLPLQKEKRKMVEVLFGWLVIFIPYIIGAIISLIFAGFVLNGYTLMASALVCIFTLLCATTLYLIVVYLLSICSSLKEAIINTIMFVVTSTLVFVSIMQFVYGCSINLHLNYYDNVLMLTVGGVLSGLSPGIFVTSLPTTLFQPDGSVISSGSVALYIILLILMVLSIVLVYVIYKAAKRRKAEYVGMKQKNVWLYSVSLVLGSFFLGLFFIASKSGTLLTFAVVQCVILGSIITTAFIYDRSKKMFTKSLLIILLSYGGSVAFQYGMVACEFFGNFRGYENVEGSNEIEVRLSRYYKGIDVNYVVRGGANDQKFIEITNGMQDHLVDKFKKEKFSISKNVEEYSEFNEMVTLDVSYLRAEDSKIGYSNPDYYYSNLTKKEMDTWIKEFEASGYEVVKEVYNK